MFMGVITFIATYVILSRDEKEKNESFDLSMEKAGIPDQIESRNLLKQRMQIWCQKGRSLVYNIIIIYQSPKKKNCKRTRIRLIREKRADLVDDGCSPSSHCIF